MTNSQQGDRPRKRKRKKAGASAAEGSAAQKKTPEERARRTRTRKVGRADRSASGGVSAPTRAARRQSPEVAVLVAASPRSRTQVLLFLAAAVAAGVVYERNLLGDDRRPYVLIALALLSFMIGASSGTNPRITVGAGAAIVCVGLAIVGTRPSELGVVLSIFGGLLLTGGIHRLGRQGPVVASLGTS